MHRLNQPHHDGSERYVAETAPDLGDVVTVWAQVPEGAGVDEVQVRTTPDAEPSWATAERVSSQRGWDWWRADIAVTNPLTNYRFLLHGSGGYRWLTAAGTTDWDPPDATDFRLSAHPSPPAWALDAVCYQVFPDRFARAGRDKPWPPWALPTERWEEPPRSGGDAAMHQLYGGDLDGISARLDHIADLGCNLVYLTPFFPAESNHRYNATSFDEVDPVLGGDAALVRLSEALHDRGMRLIGDLTLNHCGDGHRWFRTAQAEPTSPEAGYFFFDDSPAGYRSWLDVPTLPTFDLRNEQLRRQLVEGPESVAGRWLQPPYNLDGWRIDVANMVGRHGAIDENATVARTMASTMRALRPDSLLLAEHAHDASADLDGSGWHGTMYYAGFTRPAWFWLGQPNPEVDLFGMPVPLPRFSGHTAARTVDAFRAAIPWRSYAHSLMLLDSHDTARFRTVSGSAERALVGAAWMLTAPGIPMLFMGDELGLEGAHNEDTRKPMPWDERRWDRTTLAAYRDLIHLRRRHSALRRGGFRWAHVGADVLVYLREHPDERLLVWLSRAPHEPVRLPAGLLEADHAEALLDGDDLHATDGALALPGDGPAYTVWRLDPAP